MSYCNLPPLNAIKAFEAVARTGTIRDAADALSVHSTAVSRQIKNLEAWLDVALFDRGANGIHLTPDGERYFERISAALIDISEATDGISRAKTTREFRIWCAPTLAFNWLIPRLPGLQKVLPQANIVIRPTDEFANLGQVDAHIEIRYGARRGDEMTRCSLSHPTVFPVVSTRYLAGKPIPQTFAQISDQVLVHVRNSSIWHTWFEKAGFETDIHKLKGPCVWDCNLALAAAEAGVGIALCNDLTAGKLIDEGRVSKLSSTSVLLEPYVLHASTHLWNTSAVVKARQWFLDHMKIEDGTQKHAAE